MLIIKMLFYPGARVSELINIKLSDIDKDQVVPFSQGFRETLTMHMQKMKSSDARYLFESN